LAGIHLGYRDETFIVSMTLGASGSIDSLGLSLE